MDNEVKCHQCHYCNQIIDPDTCWCGNSVKDIHDNHNFVPLGCECYYDLLNPIGVNIVKL